MGNRNKEIVTGNRKMYKKYKMESPGALFIDSKELPKNLYYESFLTYI